MTTMRYWLLFTAFVIVLTAFVASGQRPGDRTPDYSTWEGSYTFVENGGKAGGTSVVVEHRLRIYRAGERLRADIDANGYQTAVALTCETSVSGAKINLYYKNRREGDTSSRTIDAHDRFKDKYYAGQLLLTLEKSAPSGKAKILTYWNGYRPVEIQPKSGRIYFRKAT